MTDRTPLFSITKNDFKFEATKGSGPGGQARNKVASAIRCTHPPSGAVGYAADDRSQHRNKALAFERCTRSDTFQKWLRIEIARHNGSEAAVQDAVNRAMAPRNLKIEVGDGKNWRPADGE